MEDFIPKIGELVVIQKGHSAWNNQGQMDKYIGQVHKFIGGGEHHCLANSTSGMTEWSWRATAGHFRKPTEIEEIRYYSTLKTLPKVGDRVILKQDNGWNSEMILKYQNLHTVVTQMLDGAFKAEHSGGWAYKGYELDTSDPMIPSPAVEISYQEGNSFKVHDADGKLQHSGEGYYWEGNREPNDYIFTAKNIRKKEFCSRLSICFNSACDGIYFKTINDLVTVLLSLNAYEQGRIPEVEFETFWEGHSIEDEILIKDQECSIQKDDSGDYPYYLSCDSDELFDLIWEKLSLNRYEYQEKILGYRDPEEYSFPQCASIKDLWTFVRSIQEFFEQRPCNTYEIIPESDIKLGQPFTLLGFKGTIGSDEEGFYWKNCEGCNDAPFLKMDQDPTNFQYSILGYRETGTFPYCHTLKDLEKFLNALENTYNSPQTETESCSQSSAISPTTGTQIIFINVPKI